MWLLIWVYVALDVIVSGLFVLLHAGPGESLRSIGRKLRRRREREEVTRT